MDKLDVAICILIVLVGVIISAIIIFAGFNKLEAVVPNSCGSGDTQRCCSDWAAENNISILKCGGRWELQDGLCNWICGKPEACKNDSECTQLVCFTEPCYRYSCVNNTCVLGK
jgi:hypothetical protein